MCGIAGLWRPGVTEQHRLEAEADAMAKALAHRGPDDQGLWVEGDSDRAAGYACAQRRLSIIDLSPLGHQPMTSACGRYVLVYNGEIYNHDDLRADLEAQGVRFRGRSDTEVLLEALARWGVAATLPRLIGMFAIALWDREARRLTLVRDRMGIKPLYWHRGADGLVLFASELKALRAVSGWVPKLDPHAVGQYFALAYIPAPRTVYLGVQKLLPGSLVTIEADGAVAEQRWWDLRDVVRNGLAARASGSSGSSAAADLAPEAITDRLEALVADACRLRMIADRPLGAFLSGGIDSATVLAAMVAQSSVPVRSFTIGFTEPNYDEAPYAAQIARHLGSDHTEMTVTPQDALDLIPSLPAMYDEPFADSSQIPTHLLSKMTQQHVTVALSGDGGDEVFAGYNRHVWTQGQGAKLRTLPSFVRHAMSGVLRSLSPEGWDRVLGALPQRYRPPQAGEKVHKLALALGAQDTASLYALFVRQWQGERLASPLMENWTTALSEAIGGGAPDGLADMEAMRLLDMLTFLPEDILTKVDRASMATGLEARVPLLDHRIVEYAWTLPPEALVQGGKGKLPLRRLLARSVPETLWNRPKMGFGVPIHAWLRGPLRDWAEELLHPMALAADGMLDPGIVRAAWEDHLSGRRNVQHGLWVVLMWRAWRQNWSLEDL